MWEYYRGSQRSQRSKGICLARLAYLVVSISPVCPARTWQESHYHRLERDLLTNYSPTVRPGMDVNTTTNISMTFTIMCLYEVDEIAQAMTQNSFMTLTWFDEFLQWDPQEYGGIQTTELSNRQVWLPESNFNIGHLSRLLHLEEVILIRPGRTKQMSAVLDINLIIVSGSFVVSPHEMSKVILKSNGHVTWFYQDVWKTICRIDITYFPFDTQQCSFSASMWTSLKSQVQFADVFVRKEEMAFIENSEWTLLSFEATAGETTYYNESYSSFTVNFHLKRRRMFHTLTLIVPNVILALLGSLVFVLPANSGEKISFIMGLLLATSVSITVLMDCMPRSSLDISFLMIYITAVSMTTGLAVVASAYITLWSSTDGPTDVRTMMIVRFLCKMTRTDLPISKNRTRNIEHLEVNDCSKTLQTYETYLNLVCDTKEDKCFSSETTEEKITWMEMAASLNVVCFRIFFSVVVVTTVILIIVLLFGLL